MASIKGGGPAWLIVPLAIGGAVALALFLLLGTADDAGTPDGPGPATSPTDPSNERLVVEDRWVFPGGPAGTGTARVLVVRGGNTTGAQMLADAGRSNVTVPAGAPAGHGPAYACAPPPGGLHWVTPALGLANATAQACAPPACAPDTLCLDGHDAVGPAVVRAPAPETARFGNGTWTANMTIYAFQANGRLIASNAPANDVARFQLAGDFQALPARPYYLGTGEAPPGTVRLPPALASLAGAIRANLTGLPEGGIALVELDRGFVYELVGHLWVTARIDDIVLPAPAAPA